MAESSQLGSGQVLGLLQVTSPAPWFFSIWGPRMDNTEPPRGMVGLGYMEHVGELF